MKVKIYIRESSDESNLDDYCFQACDYYVIDCGVLIFYQRLNPNPIAAYNEWERIHVVEDDNDRSGLEYQYIESMKTRIMADFV